VSFQIWIPGNQTDPVNGNPIPWQAMSQRSKWTSSAAGRYIAWKKYIQGCWLEKYGVPYFDQRRVHQLNIHCVFKVKKKSTGRCSHADPTNVRKGVEDALFGKFTQSDDQHVWGSTNFSHGIAPGVLIEIYGTEDNRLTASPGVE